MINLMPTLKKGTGKPVYEQLYEYIRSSVETGVFQRGDRLPSIRTAAKQLSVSKTTVVEAYDQLLLEGYIDSKDRSGYYISAEALQPKIDESEDFELPQHSRAETYNDRVDSDSFDEKLWANLVCSVIRDDKSSLLSYGEVFGESSLRTATAKYLAGMRGVTAKPSQVVIGAGMNNLASVLTKLLSIKRSIAFESPGFYRGVKIFEQLGYECIPIPLSKQGIDVSKLYESDAKLVFVTPSHQYPTGGVMSASTRRELVRWAEETDGYIIEDDYDSILRFHGRPISALQGIAPGRTVHFGSFSKLVIPAVRISYMVLPPELTKALYTQTDAYMQTASRTEQLALARFIEEGYFERHIRRIRKVYSQKNDRLCREIEENSDGKISLVGNQSGFHLLVKVDVSDLELLKEKLLERGIRTEIVSGLENIILVYYSGVEDEHEFFKQILSVVHQIP